jgi:hypothetical protein
MAYDKTLSILDIDTIIPEDFAVFHAVQDVLLKCAVQTVNPTAVPTLRARCQYMLGEKHSVP